jgi:hypothetical protein
MITQDQCDKNHSDLKDDIGEIKLDVKEIKTVVIDLRIDNALLKFKASIWGALSGGVIYAAIQLLNKL